MKTFFLYDCQCLINDELISPSGINGKLLALNSINYYCIDIMVVNWYGFFFDYRMHSWFKMRRGITRGGHSNLPVPKASRGSPGNSKSLGRGGNFAHSAEDIPQKVQNSYGTPSPHRRAVSPGDQRRGLSVPGEQGNEEIIIPCIIIYIYGHQFSGIKEKSQFQW